METKSTIEEMNYFDYFKRALFEKYTDFSSTSRRIELWSYLIIGNIIIIAVGAIFPPAGALLSFAFLIPTLAIWTRRIRDTGLPGWWAWIFIPTIIPLLIVAFISTDSFKSIRQKVGAKIDDSLDTKTKPKDAVEAIKTAKELLDAGTITQSEFDKIKKDLL